MPKYLFEGSYSLHGTQGLCSEGGSSRFALVEDMAERLGGTLDSFYFAFGDVDVYMIIELPDNEAATAFSLAVNGGGGGALKTIHLLTVEEVNAATKHTVGYRPPGG